MISEIAQAVKVSIPRRRFDELAGPQACAAAIMALASERIAEANASTYLERASIMERTLAEVLENYWRTNFQVILATWLGQSERRWVELGVGGNNCWATLCDGPARFGGEGGTFAEALSAALEAERQAYEETAP